MHIEDIMDCTDCEYLRRVPGRTWGDPHSCYPDEHTCEAGYPDSGPCVRMLESVGDVIADGELELYNGRIYTRDFLEAVQKDNSLEDMGLERWQGFDFSSASYWFFPDGGGNPAPFEDEEAVLKAFFD